MISTRMIEAMVSTLILVVSVTLIISAMCSPLEATLYSTRVAILEAAKNDGHHVVAAGHMSDLLFRHRPQSAFRCRFSRPDRAHILV